MSVPSDEDLFAKLGTIVDPRVPGARASLRVPTPGSAPARAVTERRRLAVLVAGVLWLAGNLAVFGLRPDLRTLPFSYVEWEVAIPYLLALGCLVTALATGRLGLGVNVALLAVLGVLGPALFCLLGAGVPLPHAAPPGAGSFVNALPCLGITVAWAAVPLLLAAFGWRGAFPVASARRAALLGAAVGLFAGASINLHCPNVAHFHLFMGHALPVLAATLAGAFVLARWTRT
jgi:hypothetical protein